MIHERDQRVGEVERRSKKENILPPALLTRIIVSI